MQEERCLGEMGVVWEYCVEGDVGVQGGGHLPLGLEHRQDSG